MIYFLRYNDGVIRNKKVMTSWYQCFFLQPRLAKYTKLPFPIQLVLVAIFSSLSYLLEFEKEFDVEILGDIPQG